MNPLLERGNTRLAPLDTVEPDAWMRKEIAMLGGLVLGVASQKEALPDEAIPGTTDDFPMLTFPKIESLLEAQRAENEARMAECRKEARKEALLEAAEIAGKAYATFKATEQAHYRLSAEPFIHENFGFNISVVRYSQYAEDELRRMAASVGIQEGFAREGEK